MARIITAIIPEESVFCLSCENGLLIRTIVWNSEKYPVRVMLETVEPELDYRGALHYYMETLPA